jgi:transposase
VQEVLFRLPAPYTNRQLPSLTELKSAVKAHLTQNPSINKTKVDKLLEPHGHGIVWTPPFTPEVQPIELIWSQIKGEVARNYTHTSAALKPQENKLMMRSKTSLQTRFRRSSSIVTSTSIPSCNLNQLIGFEFSAHSTTTSMLKTQQLNKLTALCKMIQTMKKMNNPINPSLHSHFSVT